MSISVSAAQPLNISRGSFFNDADKTHLSKEVHLINVSGRISCTLSGITISFNLQQATKAHIPIFVTPLPILIFSKFVQPLKALFPIKAALSGISISFKFKHSSKALLPIPVTPVGIFIFRCPAKLYFLHSRNTEKP